MPRDRNEGIYGIEDEGIGEILWSWEVIIGAAIGLALTCLIFVADTAPPPHTAVSTAAPAAAAS